MDLNVQVEATQDPFPIESAIIGTDSNMLCYRMEDRVLMVDDVAS
jgi:hypothetical protein